MTSVSINSNLPTETFHSFSSGSMLRSSITSQTLPILNKADLENFLSILFCSGASRNTINTNAYSLLKSCSHIEGSLGSPGTMMMIPVEDSSRENLFEAVVVNHLGDATSYKLTRFVNGWMSSDSTILKNFQELNEFLMQGLQDILGADLPCIPFLSEQNILSALSNLSQSEPGTYLAFSHMPITKEREEGLVAPGKRNVLVWVNANRNIEEAHFHYEPSIKTWLNGGPCITDTHEPVLSDKTLQGLVEKKMQESLGQNIQVKPLKLY
ncbi:MAG: hypothetical protein EBZ47_04510 [Chlamydiae bacterium]|nr:hypothetical protein [Chlamydiota bacterium]